MARTRNTAQKAAVLAAVTRAPHHPDATWVYEQVRREIPEISLGTVYRALAALCAEGKIREHPQPEGPDLYDANTADHFHVRCLRCGHLCDVAAAALPASLLQAVREASGFAAVTGLQVEFQGICPRCSH